MPAVKSVIEPEGVMRPMVPLKLVVVTSKVVAVNHTFPSPTGPGVMPKGALAGGAMGNSVTTPAVVMRPMRLPSTSVNHRFPSGPAHMFAGEAGEVIPAPVSYTHLTLPTKR